MRIITISEVDDSLFARQDIGDDKKVDLVLNDIRQNKDKAVRKWTRRFDGVDIKDFKINRTEMEQAGRSIPSDLLTNIKKAAVCIRIFAEKQLHCYQDFDFEITPGVMTGQRVISLERVGVYVPGGCFPLISSLLMGVIPAQVAGVKEIVVCSPPSHKKSIHPYILATASFLGIEEIYRIGGIQAVGAMAYGTETVAKVDKIAGPGNRFVTLAKKRIFGSTGIDFLAGPSEIVIIADRHANDLWIAADLAAQAEHDEDARTILITDSPGLGQKVAKHLEGKNGRLKISATARKSLKKNGLIIRVNSLIEAVDLANRLAPEHLELQVANAGQWIPQLRNFGSLFVGSLAAEVLGDYSSGLNHILPTGQAVRYTGGLSVRDFIKVQTVLQVEPKGLAAIGPVAQALAQAEGLDGHGLSVSLRLGKNN